MERAASDASAGPVEAADTPVGARYSPNTERSAPAHSPVVTPARAQMDWFVLSDRTDPRATSRRSVSFAVDTGTQKLRRADAGIA